MFAVLSLVASIVVGVAVYFVLFKMLFEDLGDFRKKLKETLIFFPLSDFFPEKVSIRIVIWLLSGLVAGLILRKLLISQL